MQNDVRSRNFPITPKPVSFFVRRSWKIELRSGRISTDAKWLNQSQVVVDRVHIPHTDSNKISVNAGARLGLLADAIRGKPSLRAGQERQKSRTIISRKVDAVIKSLAGDRRNHREVPQIASRD